MGSTASVAVGASLYRSIATVSLWLPVSAVERVEVLRDGASWQRVYESKNLRMIAFKHKI